MMLLCIKHCRNPHQNRRQLINQYAIKLGKTLRLERCRKQEAEIRAQEEALAALNLGGLRMQRDKNKELIQKELYQRFEWK